MILLKILSMTAMAMLISVSSSFAAGSGAFRVEVPDSEAMGQGSAFVARADNPSAIYYNPAGLTQLEGKAQASFGTAIIQPFNDYESPSGEKTKMRRQVFIVPHVYFVSRLGLEKFAFGIGGTTTWGLGTDWAGDSFSRYVSTEAELTNKDVMLTGAYQLTEKLSLGVAADYIDTYIDKQKKIPQLGGPDGNSRSKGRDRNTWAYRLALLYKFNERHQFGFQYRSSREAKYRGKVLLDDLNGALALVFGGSSYETDASAELTFPQSIVAGYSYKPTKKLTFEFDVEWMDWSSIKQEKIIFESEKSPVRLGILNLGNPIARNWKSVFSFAFGTEYELSERMRLRSGYFYHDSPIPEETFDPSLPDSDSHGVTAGIGYDVTDKLTIDFAYTGMFFEERNVENDVGALVGASIDGTYTAFNNIFLTTFSYQF